MEIVFLGTASMMPTTERAQTAVYMSYQNEHFLFDCGEGTQRQLRIAGISPAKITRVFLTHWHGDHFFGLPGLLENMAKHKAQKIIDVYGPKGTKKHLTNLITHFFLKNKITVRIHEIHKNGIFLNEDTFSLRATHVKHGIPCVAYTFEEKPKRKIKMDYLKQRDIPEGPLLRQLQDGKSITFRGKKISVKEATYLQPGKRIALILDTEMDAAFVAAAKEADFLICESTFHSSLADKAKEYFHLTAKEAALIAKKAKVKKLVLTHFSQRYKDVRELEQEAKDIFPATIVSHDFMRLEI
jgi:ribonuclease Z